MLLSEVVAASGEVAATRSRKAKVATLSGVLSRAARDEVCPLAAWLAGEMLQGRTGVGWRTLSSLDLAPATQPTLTVVGVDAALDRLAALAGSGTGVGARRGAELTALFGAATDEEARFLLRLLGGELRQGALEGLMVEAVADAASRASAATGNGAVPADAVRRAFMLSGRLPTTARIALTEPDPVAALGRVGLEVLRPVRPMLASPGDSLADALAELGTDVVVEQKFDGARIQCHRAGDEVRVFTRTLRDITDAVPDTVALLRSLPARTLVLDGETLALDDDGRPRAFQDTMRSFGSGRDAERSGEHADTGAGPIQGGLQPWFFDCLHRDGVDLVDEPLSVRRAALAEVVGDQVIPGVERPTPEQAEEAVRGSLAAGHEGSMVKALDSVYAAGRRGRAWQKVKPVHTLDLVVLACEWGSGRRRGWLSNIHLGARDPSTGGFVMIGKTFKGMTDATLRWQTATFPEHETRRDAHTVYLRPEIVVEIELDGVQRSTRYPGGVALRFARVVRYRDDKPASEADTLDTVRGLLL